MHISVARPLTRHIQPLVVGETVRQRATSSKSAGTTESVSREIDSNLQGLQPPYSRTISLGAAKFPSLLSIAASLSQTLAIASNRLDIAAAWTGYRDYLV